MASSYKSKNLFGSGPHRFAIGRQGHLLVSDVELGSYTPKTNAFGLLELEVTVRGRLVSTSDSGLWTLRDAVVAELLDPPTAGTLVDHTGRSFASMSFVMYTEANRVDRGRTWSIAYVARFRRLLA